MGASWGVVIVGGGAVGLGSGLLSNAIQQAFEPGPWNWKQFGEAGLSGAIGGSIGGAVFKGLAPRLGLLKNTSERVEKQLACDLARMGVASFALRHGIVGGVGGFAGDAANQGLGLAFGYQEGGFRWDQFGGAGLGGAFGGAVNYAGMRGMMKVCFRAGTPIMAQFGSKAIEEFKSYEEHGDACDRLISRSECAEDGVLTVRRVLRRFERWGQVLELQVCGQIIGTTHEHPFFVRGKGWTSAGELKAGDEVRLMAPGWIAVESVTDTGKWEKVYNLEIEDDHTYFVGCDEWGFSVWAHNACNPWNDFQQVIKSASGHLTPTQVRKAYAAAANGNWQRFQKILGGRGFQAGEIPTAYRAATNTEPYILLNRTHSTSMPQPKGVGPNGGGLQSHHGLQDKWASANLPGWKYGSAPTVTLETGAAVPGTHGTLPHTVISTRQNARQATREAASKGSWSMVDPIV